MAFGWVLALARVMARSEAVSGVRLVDLLFARFDEGIDRRAIATGQGSEGWKR